MDVPRTNPLGTAAAIAASAAVRKVQTVTKVTESDRAGASLADDRRTPEQDSAAAEARDIAALRREVERRTLAAGPPPAFRISILEAESGIEQALARIEATRAQTQQAPALDTAPNAHHDGAEDTGMRATQTPEEPPNATALPTQE